MTRRDQRFNPLISAMIALAALHELRLPAVTKLEPLVHRGQRTSRRSNGNCGTAGSSTYLLWQRRPGVGRATG